MLEKLLERVARALDKATLPYMIIGGQAVLFYREPRLTKDIDITLGVGIDRLPEVILAASSAGLRILVDPDSFTRKTSKAVSRFPEVRFCTMSKVTKAEVGTSVAR